mgnify:CR=1 FL=1
MRAFLWHPLVRGLVQLAVLGTLLLAPFIIAGHLTGGLCDPALNC